MTTLIVLGLCLPLIGFVANRLLGATRRREVRLVGPGVVGLAFVFFLLAAILAGGHSTLLRLYTWVPAIGHASNLVGVQRTLLPRFELTLYLDSLSALMTLVVTGVGFLIHVYSAAYMDDEDDAGYARFFAHMNLFVFSMLLLLLAFNFILLVVGWALVGLSSYLLIGFYRDRGAAVLAARKAFVMNVIGDVGIVIASFVALGPGGPNLDRWVRGCTACTVPLGTFVPRSTYELIGFFLLVGAVAKSAQVPLHTWLPDAMEGPTPVSALIHAATMVTAGVYLIARFSEVYAHAPSAATTATVIGAGTALMAALIATVQDDIKRVLAYSTMSQIGYMFFAVAVGAQVAGIFHLVTHAFFKALLFLAAGAVIHALHGEQDMRLMGGLGDRLRSTRAAFLVGVLALAGVIPLSGFFSKDEIIAAAFDKSWLAAAVLLLTAALTAYYMLRAYLLVFAGQPRADHHGVHEPPPLMALPIAALAFLAVVGGLLQPGPWHLLSDYTRQVFGAEVARFDLGRVLVILASLAAAAAGLGVAWLRFGTSRLAPPFSAPQILVRKFYWDDLYGRFVVEPIWTLGRAMHRALERPVFAGTVDEVAGTASAIGREVRRLQSGFIRDYALAFAGAALVIALLVGWGTR